METHAPGDIEAEAALKEAEEDADMIERMGGSEGLPSDYDPSEHSSGT